jgi:hypothetical protein
VTGSGSIAIASRTRPVDQRLNRVRYHRRRQIEVLAPAAQRPSLKLAAGRVAVMQTGMGLEVDYILGGTESDDYVLNTTTLYGVIFE